MFHVLKWPIISKLRWIIGFLSLIDLAIVLNKWFYCKLIMFPFSLQESLCWLHSREFEAVVFSSVRRWSVVQMLHLKGGNDPTWQTKKRKKLLTFVVLDLIIMKNLLGWLVTDNGYTCLVMDIHNTDVCVLISLGTCEIYFSTWVFHDSPRIYIKLSWQNEAYVLHICSFSINLFNSLRTRTRSGNRWFNTVSD